MQTCPTIPEQLLKGINPRTLLNAAVWMALLLCHPQSLRAEEEGPMLGSGEVGVAAEEGAQEPSKKGKPATAKDGEKPPGKSKTEKSAAGAKSTKGEDAADGPESKAKARFETLSATWVAGFADPASPVKLEPLTPEGEKVVKNLAAWAKFVAKGDFSKARAFPVAGNWNVAADQMSPNYLVSLIQQGHHVAVAFEDPHGAAFGHSTPDGRIGPKLQETLDEYYRPALEFAKAYQLPIVFRGWNWAADPTNYQNKLATQRGVEFAPEELAAVLVDGKPDLTKTDPLGPVKAWEDWGRFWFGNVLIRELQEIYPNPPLVIFLNNNEAGDFSHTVGYEKSDRFVEKFGTDARDRSFVDKVVREGFIERYAAMFQAARASLQSPAWKENTRLVAYNTIFGAAYFGNGRLPSPGVWFDNDLGLVKWRIFDGSMPEMYDNDWQPGKRDFTVWNMQAEMGAVHEYENFLRKERPDFISGMIVWEGAVTSEVFRGRRGTSKAFNYAVNGLRWNFDRYEGWITFGLWAMRPALFWEFRAGEPVDAVRLGTWLAHLRATDQVWNSEVLHEFWEKGRLVANTEQDPWFNELPENSPEWLTKLNRWFLLTSDANPPREQWERFATRLQVIAQALEVGEKPNRRWLVVAHSPEQPTASPTVSIPGYGPVRLPSLSRTCSFFVVNEADGSITPVLEGGPAALELSIASEGQRVRGGVWLAKGTDVEFDLQVAHAPGLKLEEFVWEFGDGTTKNSTSAGKMTHRFDKEGTYLVRVNGRQGGETLITEQIPVFIGQPPTAEIVYDLALDQALDWKGPWAGDGENGANLVTYQHLPNKGDLASPVVVGGRFVEDPERGRVYEMTGAPHEGIYLARNRQTVMREGKPSPVGPTGPRADNIQSNRTISFWFKAEDTQTRQVLFAEGFDNVGMNIYLDGGNLYAGCFAPVDGTIFGQDPVSGYNWPGEWISAPVEAGKWYHVKWVLKDAGPQVEADKQSLYLNENLVGRASAGGLPTLYVVPRIGRTNVINDSLNGKKRAVTRFHDQAERDKVPSREQNALNTIPVFKGRLDDFRYINTAETPVE